MSKSPVYGLGRNRNHRPPKAVMRASAANVNMHGKKHKVMGCYCCYCVDLREDILKKLHTKEIRDFTLE